jgi:hypothetical protein
MSQENAKSKQPLIRQINRQQMSWWGVDVERLIGEDHRARAIWTLVGRLNLCRFYENIESSVEEGGRPAGVAAAGALHDLERTAATRCRSWNSAHG